MPYFPIGHVLLYRESAVRLKVWFAVAIDRDSTRKGRPGGSAFSFLMYRRCLAQSERLLAPLTSVYDASDAGHDLMGHPGERLRRRLIDRHPALARRWPFARVGSRRRWPRRRLRSNSRERVHNGVAIYTSEESPGSVDGASLSGFLKTMKNLECVLTAGIAVSPPELEFRLQSPSGELSGKPLERGGSVRWPFVSRQRQQHFGVSFIERIESQEFVDVPQQLVHITAGVFESILPIRDASVHCSDEIRQVEILPEPRTWLIHVFQCQRKAHRSQVGFIKLAIHHIRVQRVGRPGVKVCGFKLHAGLLHVNCSCLGQCGNSIVEYVNFVCDMSQRKMSYVVLLPERMRSSKQYVGPYSTMSLTSRIHSVSSGTISSIATAIHSRDVQGNPESRCRGIMLLKLGESRPVTISTSRFEGVRPSWLRVQ
ncbi:hypothetical protein ACVK00_000349 [Burkholderia sp. PvR073]